MAEPLNLDAQLAAISTRLAARRDAVLAGWRAAVADDAQVTAADSLSRTQFVDHIPEILEGLTHALGAGRLLAPAAAADSAHAGSGHGQHRWQQGYSLIELTREWSHLQLALVGEMQQVTAETPGLSLEAINIAYRTIAILCLEGMSESTRQFERMQRTEAAGQVNDLGRSLLDARELERRQADILRVAAHDLRGSMGIISSATAALHLRNLPEERRAELLEMAQRAVRAHTRLLTDLMDLARLQAGYERREIRVTDVARLLRELCDGTGPIATAQGLYLQFDGPDRLEVEADASKVARIVQNLLLNALHYTRHGGVRVQCGSGRADDKNRWYVQVQDTGPGIQQGPAAPLAVAIEQATQEAPPSERSPPAAVDDGSASAPSSEPEHPGPPRHGEGIGLSIVKRLCELLDATLEMHSVPGEGTTFAAVFPRHYARQ